MKDIVRLLLRTGLPLFVVSWCAYAQAQSASPQPATSSATDSTLTHARVFPYDQMTVRKMANGGESRDVLRGALATGEVVGIHESMQPAGAQPNPAHSIQHSEFILIQEGTVDFIHDGKTERVGAGGVIYVAFGTLHQLKNVGSTQARYVVIQIGGDTKK